MSQPPLSVLEEIDGVCDQFERALHAGRPARIEDFYGRIAPPFDVDLLKGLIDVDLHHNWSGSHYKTSALTAATAEAYQERFPQLRGGSAEALWHGVIISEFEIRQRSGDRPTLDHFLTRFPHIPNLAAACYQVLREVNPCQVRLYEFKRLQLSVRLQRRLELGRQRTTELTAPRLIEMADCDRLLIALPNETTVGRQHADCEQIARDQIRVRNFSRKSVVMVSGSHAIPHNGVWVGSPPILLQIAHKLVRIEEV